DDDIFFLGLGEGNNRITGGTGTDQFWLSEDDNHVFTAGRNIIADFNTDEGDVIGLAATSLSFDSDDFNLIQEGTDTVIETFGQEIAVLNGINSTELTAANFVFS
ncbi:MAG: alkaline phosphatase, partial [Microcystaceae cyanobacterium]